MGKLELETTVMALREEIMRYFKGTCIDRVTTNRNVNTIPLSAERGQYQYQRIERDRQNSCGIYLEDVQLFRVQQSPEKITFTSELYRSPELTQVRKAIDKFMGRFLRSVEIERYEGKEPKQVSDKKLLKSKVREGGKKDKDMFAMYEEAMRMRVDYSPRFVWNTETMEAMSTRGVQYYTMNMEDGSVQPRAAATTETDLTDVPF